MIKIAEQWGAELAYNVDERVLSIKGNTSPQNKVFTAGESALCLRLMIPTLARFTQTSTLQADGTLMNRPIGEIETILNQFGAKIQSSNGFPPLKIKGKLKPSNFVVEFMLSSQNISGLLFSLPFLEGNSTIRLKKLVSLPYLKVSLKCLTKAGIKIQTNDTYTEYFIEGEQQLLPLDVAIEGDWSSAAIIIAGAAVKGDVTLENLSLNSLQADKEIKNYIELKNYRVQSQKIKPLKANITHCPDLFPALMVLALHSDGFSEITGMNRLLHKESNRAETFIEEFSKFGANFSIVGDTLQIRPPKEIHTCEINSHNDHRIAMAAALAVVGTKATVTILGSESVNKSYPSFWEDLSCLGAKVEKI